MKRILIIGAGPAGMSTALFLAKKNIPSTLIEKETFPRDKICGDGLSGWVVTMLKRINPELIQKLSQHPESQECWGFRIVTPNQHELNFPFVNKRQPDQTPAFTMKRKAFDQLLMNEIKQIEATSKLIQVVENTKILSCETTDSAFTAIDQNGKQFQGELAVLATGAKFQIVNNLSLIATSDRHHVTAIKTYFKGLHPPKTGPEHPAYKNPIELFFLRSVLPGYLWIFHLPDGQANVGLGIRTDLLRKNRIRLKTLLNQAISHEPELMQRFADSKQIAPIEAWGLPVGSKKRPLSGNRFLLAGDAASLIDPFTGEGIGNALNSGYHAANHIENCISQKDFDATFNKLYDQAIYDKLWPELKHSARIQGIIKHPKLINAFGTIIANSPVVQQQVTKIIHDEKQAKKLLNPLFYIKAIISKR